MNENQFEEKPQRIFQKDASAIECNVVTMKAILEKFISLGTNTFPMEDPEVNIEVKNILMEASLLKNDGTNLKSKTQLRNQNS